GLYRTQIHFLYDLSFQAVDKYPGSRTGRKFEFLEAVGFYRVRVYLQAGLEFFFLSFDLFDSYARFCFVDSVAVSVSIIIFVVEGRAGRLRDKVESERVDLLLDLIHRDLGNTEVFGGPLYAVTTAGKGILGGPYTIFGPYQNNVLVREIDFGFEYRHGR